MGVEACHPKYNQSLMRWRLCQAAFDGSEAVKAMGTDVLPALSSHSNNAMDPQGSSKYKKYSMRALYYNATARTVQALLGIVFAKDPTITIRDETFLTSVTKAEDPFDLLAKRTAEKIIVGGRAGLFIDSPENPHNLPYVQPYISLYSATCIRNWRVERIEGRRVLTLVVLYEEVEVDPTSSDAKDEFDTSLIEQLRVLQLKHVGEGRLQYSQRVYRKGKKSNESSKDEWVPFGEEVVPKMRGKPLESIPFVFIGTNSLGADPCPIPISDLVEVNLSHFRTSADLEHGRHFTALPTAVASGFRLNSGESLMVGSEAAWVTEDIGADAKYLEFTGQGLGSLENALKEKESQMAILGARLLEPEKAAAEAAQTHKLKKSSEGNVIASISGTISLGLTNALRILYEWRTSADPSGIVVELNRDIFGHEVSLELLTKLMEGVQQGLVSWKTLYYNMERADLYPPNTDEETEKDLIENDSPDSSRDVTPDDLDEEEEEEPEQEEEQEEEEEEGRGE